MVCLRTIQHWVARFKENGMLVDDRPRTGRPREEIAIGIIQDMLENDQHISAREIARRLGINKNRVVDILKKSASNGQSAGKVDSTQIDRFPENLKGSVRKGDASGAIRSSTTPACLRTRRIMDSLEKSKEIDVDEKWYLSSGRTAKVFPLEKANCIGDIQLGRCCLDRILATWRKFHKEILRRRCDRGFRFRGSNSENS